MKKEVPKEILMKYRIPRHLTDFQLKMYIHLIDWKWKNITREPGTYNGIDYDAIIPDSLRDKSYPIYQPIVDEYRKIQTFKKHKHINHMASSQAACINLFHPLLRDEKIANQVLSLIKSDFGKLATGHLENGFQFEYWDKSNPLNDHSEKAGTDADIAIAYYDNRGKLSLWLLEHKFTEDDFTTCGGYRSKSNLKREESCRAFALSEDTSNCYYKYKLDYRYWDTVDPFSIYNKAEFLNRVICPFKGGENQLWRNQIMAEAIKQNGVFENVYLSVVHHPENKDLEQTISSYISLLNRPSDIGILTFKDFLDAASNIKSREIEDWMKWYKEFYNVQ